MPLVPREKYLEMNWRAADKVAAWKTFKWWMNVIFVADQIPDERQWALILVAGGDEAYCRAIMLSIKQGMVKVNTWVFILRRYKWHIHAGSWSLVNCWREGSTLPYKGCSWILMNAAVGHMDGSALMVIGVSAWYPDIPLSPWKKRLCLHAKKLLLEIYHGP